MREQDKQETVRLNLEISKKLKRDFNLAAMKNGSKMTPLIIQFMPLFFNLKGVINEH